MLSSEKVAIAAHLHVLLRRKTGRVTDTEWMANNLEYAAEIIRFTREHAKEPEHADLAEWANKLEAAVLGERKAIDAASKPRERSHHLPLPQPNDNASDAGFLNTIFGNARSGNISEADLSSTLSAPRYVGGLR